MFKEVALDSAHHLINHGPTVLITSGRGKKINVAPIAWVMPVNNDPPFTGIAVAGSHYTAELIKETGELVINIPDKKLLPAVIACGKISGRKEDKFKKADLKIMAGIKTETPHLEECIGFLECRVKDTLDYDGVLLFIAEVIYAAAEEDLYDDYWISEKAETIHHLGSRYFALTGKRFKI